MDLNPFRLCSGLKFLGYFMILLVAAIIAVSYYAVVILTSGPYLLDGGSKSFLAFFIVIIFHILLVLLTWCYLMVVLRDPGSVPENWRLLPEVNLEEGGSNAISDNMACDNSAYDTIACDNSATSLPSEDGPDRRSAVRYCSHCQNGKPPRCHHCSICQRCILKMDHHCIWVVNCVGARNYKFFLLFVFYTFLETTMGTLVLLPSFIKFFQHAKHRSESPGNLAVSFLAFDFVP